MEINIKMNITKYSTNKLSFGDQKPPLVLTNNANNTKELYVLTERINAVIKEIGGINLYSDNTGNIQIALAKIEMLRLDTQRAWGNCPSALEQKLNRLDLLKNELNGISDLLGETNQNIDSHQQNKGLILPKKELDLVSGIDALTAYNLLDRNPSNIQENKIRKLCLNAISQESLENSLKEIKKSDWNFEKLNAEDSKIYPQLSTQLIMGNIKTTIEKQIKTLDEKLIKLQNEKGTFVTEVGVKVYDPKVTGQILALETAKLRRISVQSPIIMPNIEQRLSNPAILAQPIPSDFPLFFKIDKKFIPKKVELQQILKLNEPFKPVLNKLFPEGLNVFMVPGYTDDKMGSIEGGISLPGYPDKGIWLNSYDFKERYNYTSNLEKVIGALRSVSAVKPSVLKGSNDRARALAHEIAHSISYKLENNHKQKNIPKASGLLVTDCGNINFADGWRMLRTNVQFNDRSLKDDARFMTKGSLGNLRQVFEYEAIAEDIRTALTDKNLPAASSMTSFFDQTEEGKKQVINIKNYVCKCLLEDKSPSEVIFEQVSNKKFKTG